MGQSSQHSRKPKSSQHFPSFRFSMLAWNLQQVNFIADLICAKDINKTDNEIKKIIYPQIPIDLLATWAKIKVINFSFATHVPSYLYIQNLFFKQMLWFAVKFQRSHCVKRLMCSLVILKVRLEILKVPEDLGTCLFLFRYEDLR